MKRFERFLAPMIMVGILVLSGCEKPGSAMWPMHSLQISEGQSPATQQAAATANAYREKIL